MLEWIISSSVLIAVVIALRLILKGKISLRLQYALWALVLVRLLLPVSIGNSAISVMNPVEQSQVYQNATEPEVDLPEITPPVTVIPDPSYGENTSPIVIPNTNPSTGNTGTAEPPEHIVQPEQNTPLPETPPTQEAPGPQPDSSFDLQSLLRTTWLVGSVLLGVWFLSANLLFFAKLRKNRAALPTTCKLPVYVCTCIDTPCLFGLFRPAVYLTEDVAADERTMRHAVEHELTHYRHRDHIWAALRCVCLAVHWYNPLVWCAAILSKNDAELSCDESTIRRLGEGERAEYGRTLLRLTCEKRTAIMTTATTMTGSGKMIKERIALIVKKPKMALYTLIAVVVIAAIAIVCTFTGAQDKPGNHDDPADNITEGNSDSEDSGNHEDNSDSENNDEPEISEDLSHVLTRLETLTAEDIVSYGYMQADADILIPLVNAAAEAYTPITVSFNPGQWSIQLNLTEIQDIPGHNPEVLCFTIGLTEDIVHVHHREDTVVAPYEIHEFYLNSPDLWNYIFSLYNPDGIDQAALGLYGDILADRARTRIAEHAVNLVSEGFPELTGFEVASLRLTDSFYYEGYYFRVFSYDIAYLTDDPNPDRYLWAGDGYADDQGRIRRYDPCPYMVVAYANDDYVGVQFFSHSIFYDIPLYFRTDIIECFTGQKLYLDWKSGEFGDHIYTNDGIVMELPHNFVDLVEAHRDSDTWCHGLIMNPTYYQNNPQMTNQTLFALYHVCEYWEDGSGLLFSIQRYTQEEYHAKYSDIYSRQQVFARDDTYYYCVFVPTPDSAEDPETAAIIENLLNNQLLKIMAGMIYTNGWTPFNGVGDKISPILSLPEEQTGQAGRLSDAVIAYAMEYVQGIIDYFNECGANPADSVSYYAITKAKITSIEYVPTPSVGLTDGLYLYRLEYRLLANHPENIMMAGGMAMEDGWLTEWGSTGQPYLLLWSDWSGEETVWKRVCVTNTDVIMTDYGTPEMLEQYEDPYLAAAIELYHKYLQENSTTLPALPLSDHETAVINEAVRQNLKTGWWKGWDPLMDCTYEAGVFRCVYRETASVTERLYGYAGYFRFDENGNSVEYWYCPAIITIYTENQSVLNIWWPRDGAYHEMDILSYFPEEIAEFIAEPNEERNQVILAQLEEMAKAVMTPEETWEVLEKLSALQGGDIVYVDYESVDAFELADAVRSAMEHRIAYRDLSMPMWDLSFYLSGGPEIFNTQSDEWVYLIAGLEENIVHIYYHDPALGTGTICVEDETLYWLLKTLYNTDGIVNEEEITPYRDILDARAQETVDRSEQYAGEEYPRPYTGYEIVQFERIDSFEQDGAQYIIYKWDVAFLTDDPHSVVWAGGMWMDSQDRVREVEGYTYFVVCISGDTVAHDFFFWDLYFGENEDAGRENAHKAIIAKFTNA